MFWAKNITVPVLIISYLISLFLTVTCSSHSSLLSCPSSSHYTLTVSRLSQHPFHIGTLHVHTPLKSTPIHLFPFDPLHRCFSLTYRPAALLLLLSDTFSVLAQGITENHRIICLEEIVKIIKSNCSSLGMLVHNWLVPFTWFVPFVLQIKPACTGNKHLPSKGSLVEQGL